jgi:hypothetical protein
MITDLNNWEYFSYFRKLAIYKYLDAISYIVHDCAPDPFIIFQIKKNSTVSYFLQISFSTVLSFNITYVLSEVVLSGDI